MLLLLGSYPRWFQRNSVLKDKTRSKENINPGYIESQHISCRNWYTNAVQSSMQTKCLQNSALKCHYVEYILFHDFFSRKIANRFVCKLTCLAADMFARFRSITDETNVWDFLPSRIAHKNVIKSAIDIVLHTGRRTRLHIIACTNENVA